MVLAGVPGLWSVSAAQSSASPELLREFNARRAVLAEDDVSGRIRLAKWASDHDLFEQAAELRRETLERAPDNHSAYRGLIELGDNRPLQLDSQAYRNARAAVPGHFADYETSRFVVISDADRQWALAQAHRLERAHHQFQRFCKRLALRPMPLRHKLVCILFRDRQDYQRFAREKDSVEDPWISGYYSPRHDWVVFYHVESNPSLSEARMKLDEMEARMAAMSDEAREAELAGRIERVRAIRETLGVHQKHYNDERARVEEFAAQVAVATTVHEATHQLFFHTRVQSPRVQYPLWICEGLATSFETANEDNAFGPEYEYGPRQTQFRTLLRQGELLPVRELATLMKIPDDEPDLVQIVYHQSYGLVRWMCRYRKAELRTYLELMRDQPSGRPSQAKLRAIFEEAFGDADALERAWLRHEQSLLARVDASSVAKSSQEFIEPDESRSTMLVAAALQRQAGMPGSCSCHVVGYAAHPPDVRDCSPSESEPPGTSGTRDR